MGSIGKCCCNQECCGAFTSPTDWVVRTACCSECDKTLSAAWTYECSAAIRTDTRNASVDFEYYLHGIGTREQPFLQLCNEDPPSSGIYVCPDGITPCTEAAGIWSCTSSAFPDCDVTPDLCATVSLSKTENYSLKLVARWKPISRVSTLSRISTKCGAEEAPTCKWLLVSRTCLQIEWGVEWFLSGTSVLHSDSACCVVDEVNATTTAKTCEVASTEMATQNQEYVCLTRIKYYTSAPSGVITMNPGDTVTCDYAPADVCLPATSSFKVSDTDEIEIAGPTSSSEVPWIAPACYTSSHTEACEFMDLLGGVCAGTGTEDPDQLVTFDFAGVTGSLIAFDDAQIGNICQGSNCVGIVEHIKTLCLNLTSGRTDSGHTNRSIVITLPAWTVDLGGC